MFRKLLLAAALLAPLSATAQQAIQQSGVITPRHLPYWVTSGVIADGGTSADSPISSIGATGEGTPAICASSQRASAAGRNQICMGAATNGPAFISLQNYGTATAQNLEFIVNGIPIILPTGGGSFITGTGTFNVNDVVTFASTGGVVQDSGLAVASGVVTSGTWHGSPIAVAFGGTGATTQAGAQSALGLGTMATQNANSVAITGGTITGMPSPVNASDVAIKSYVDASAQGLTILAPSRLATAAVLPNTPTYSNGTAGVGATLTAGANSTLTVDGTVANLNDVILVNNQASAFQNGIYTVTNAGSGAAAWVLTRATYFDQSTEMVKGSYTFVTAGSTNINSAWVLQTTTTTVGTTAVNFSLFSSTSVGVTSIAGNTGAFSLSGGLTNSGNAIQLATSGIDYRGGVLNGTVVESHSSNAVTFALKTLSGNDATATNPIYIGFPSNSTQIAIRSVTSALSMTISAGSTLGIQASSMGTRIGIVAMDNNGTVVLGVGNFPSPPSSDNATFSSVAEGGSGTADSTETIYTPTTLTGLFVQPVAWASYGQFATPGNWTTSPSSLSMWNTDRSAMPYDLTTRPETPPSQFTSAIFRPKKVNSVQYLDLGVNGTPSPTSENLLGWYDTCDADLIANPQANTHCARLAVNAAGHTVIGNYDYGPSPGAGDFFFVSNNTSLIKIFSSNGTLVPVADGASALGFTSNRWSAVYAVNGTIQTSDAREKKDLAPIDDRVLRAISTVEIKQWRWIDGDGKINFGPTVQEIDEAFKKEGLSINDYGMVTTDEKTGHFGLNYAQFDLLKHEADIRFPRSSGGWLSQLLARLF